MTKAIEVVYLTRVEGANLNSAGTEGVISVLKKVEDIDGKEFVRISGQSVKYQIRQIWKEQGKDKGLEISNIVTKSESNEKVIVSEGKPEQYIDDDLFGYMITKENRKRTASIRTSGMISLFPYAGDRDFGVRYDPKGESNHNIFETEITTNIMRGNFFIEVDRLGKFGKGELKDKDGDELPKKEKNIRVKAFFDAVMNLSGGAHLSNFFTKTYPEVMVVAVLKRKTPIIGDKLAVSGKGQNGRYILDEKRLKEALETFEDNIEEVFIGGFETTIENWEEIKKLGNSKIQVMPLKELKKKLAETDFFK
jgi:CRISPR-associated protein Cst2